MRSTHLAWVFPALLLADTGCAHHVRLISPSTPDSSTYVCRTTNGAPNCQPSTVVDPAMANAARTAFVTLPRECNGRIQQILVRDADSSSPEVYVTCAAVVNDTGTFGSTTPPPPP